MMYVVLKNIFFVFVFFVNSDLQPIWGILFYIAYEEYFFIFLYCFSDSF